MTSSLLNLIRFCVAWRWLVRWKTIFSNNWLCRLRHRRFYSLFVSISQIFLLQIFLSSTISISCSNLERYIQCQSETSSRWFRFFNFCTNFDARIESRRRRLNLFFLNKWSKSNNAFVFRQKNISRSFEAQLRDFDDELHIQNQQIQNVIINDLRTNEIAY